MLISDGFIHDTHTITAALPEAVKITGDLTSEFCWFPGYMWRYVYCAYCGKHLGWKYFSRNLIPRSFLGLSGNNIYFDNVSNLEMDNGPTNEADSSADEWWINLNSIQLRKGNWRNIIFIWKYDNINRNDQILVPSSEMSIIKLFVAQIYTRTYTLLFYYSELGFINRKPMY